MNKNEKLIVWIIVIAIIIVVSYRLYSPTVIEEFNALNYKNIRHIKRVIDNKKEYNFAVVGNVKNSINIFDKKIINRIQKDNIDFIISTGNNVLDGGEGKYRVLYRSLQQTDRPFITGLGENEVIEGGHKNYYKYFGPFFYSFYERNSFFIFLDTTGETPLNWQKEWIKEELERAKDFENIFVFMNRPPFKMGNEIEGEVSQNYLQGEENRDFFQNIFAQYQVEAVFSSNLPLYYNKEIQGVDYFITGGAGGELLLEEEDSVYHYLKVNVDGQNTNYSKVELKNTFSFIDSQLAKILVNLWVSLQSFLYTNYLNILLFVLIFGLAAIVFYLNFTQEIDYYQSVVYLKDEIPKQNLNIAMFTNNYFPNIGGVPISIYRLTKGLEKLGHNVYIFAPDYSNKREYEERENVIRCDNLFYYKKEGLDMPIVNIFSKNINDQFDKLDIDVVHTHHPFLMGKKGLKLAKKYNKTLIYTYHTRLEKYVHYLPDIGFIKMFFKKWLAHVLIRRFSNKCDAVFAPTETACQYLRNVGVRKYIEVLPTGVELANYKRDKFLSQLEKKYDDVEIILFSVSRLSKEKNLYFLLEGIKYIRSNTACNFKLLLAGEGGEKENIKNYIEENNLEKYIELLGLVDNQKISKYYMLADLFIFASKSETQGMVLLEAMAGENPVVAVRSSGIEDVIKNGENGYKTKEEVSEWGNKIVELMENSDKRKKIGGNAYEFAENHSIKNMAQRADKIYQKAFYLKKGKNRK